MDLVKDEQTREVLEDVLYILEMGSTNEALAYIRSRLGYAISVTIKGVGYPGFDAAVRHSEGAHRLVRERRTGESDA